MNIVEGFAEKVKRLKRRVLFPEGTNETILRASCELQKSKIAQPVLMGKEEAVYLSAERLNLSIEGIEVVDAAKCGYIDELVCLYCRNRKNVKAGVAKKLLRRNLVFGGMLLASDRVDALVAGVENTTASVIQAAALTVGYRQSVSTPSSFFIMSLPDGRGLFYADCAVNIEPDSKQLAEIAVTTADSFKKLTGGTPKVAFLSFSTKGSASHALVEKVQKAVRMARDIDSGILMDGEFQADTALSETVAAKKLKGQFSGVAGNANILIFPDLNAGNIAYKLTQYLAGAAALGPILQGFAKPVSDLSRGAGVSDVVGAAAVTCLMA